MASTLIASSGFLGQLGAWDGVGSAEAEIAACPVPNATRTIDREWDVNYWCEEQFWCKDQIHPRHNAHTARRPGTNWPVERVRKTIRLGEISAGKSF